jgi:hypothetical protein
VHGGLLHWGGQSIGVLYIEGDVDFLAAPVVTEGLSNGRDMSVPKKRAGERRPAVSAGGKLN